ncbi:LytTR family DNA-binding domain-containing protein [Arenimonas caeni]|jgi:two-component system response regulator AlgR|uniref:LytR/AlgR family response regulator transcription factor n=1 Tax=Arenimonas caeni TaxID=2058085 RepID=UPI002A3628AF|nr:LytTR family DNA-binding domain-containing protein [Arenimonas caeni]MDY0021439.1 LytTR family DNA-binding domain-containing protein [Arenimonas caeni]
MKLLIVDDEPLARQRLAALVSELGGHVVAGEAGNGREAVEQAEALGVDGVLLDISMPVMDGLEAAHHLAALRPPPAVIFCTAYDQHALAAFEAAAVDYLVKPVRKERLAEALERARRHRSAQQLPALPGAAERRRSHLSARLRGSLRLIPVEDIRYLQAEEKYVVVHHARGEDLIEESLKSLELEFADRFIRIHRNCLVAADEFAELRRGTDGQVRAILRNSDAALEVSRRCLPALRERLKHL